MRLKLLSPGDMREDQKQTYDESIAASAGARPAGPDDGWSTDRKWRVTTPASAACCGRTQLFRHKASPGSRPGHRAART